MRIFPLFAFFLGVIILCTGCASFVNGKFQQVKIHSVPEGADVKLDDFNICQTPCFVELRRRHVGLLTATLDGYPIKSVALSEKFSAASLWGNFYNGFLPGWIYDYLYGAANDLVPAEVIFIFDEELAMQNERMYQLGKEQERNEESRKKGTNVKDQKVTYYSLQELSAKELDDALAKLLPWEREAIVAAGQKRVSSCHSGSVKISFWKRVSKKERSLLNKLCEKGIIQEF